MRSCLFNTDQAQPHAFIPHSFMETFLGIPYHMPGHQEYSEEQNDPQPWRRVDRQTNKRRVLGAGTVPWTQQQLDGSQVVTPGAAIAVSFLTHLPALKFLFLQSSLHMERQWHRLPQVSVLSHTFSPARLLFSFSVQLLNTVFVLPKLNEQLFALPWQPSVFLEAGPSPPVTIRQPPIPTRWLVSRWSFLLPPQGPRLPTGESRLAPPSFS